MGHFLDRVERGTVPDQLTENPKERNVRTMQDIMADNKREGVKMPSVYGEIVKQGEKKDSAKKAQINKSTGAAKTTSSGNTPLFPNTTIGEVPANIKLKSAAQKVVVDENPFVQKFLEKLPGALKPLDLRSDTQKNFDMLSQIKKWETAKKDLVLDDGTNLGKISTDDATKIANNPKLGALTSDSNKNVSRYIWDKTAEEQQQKQLRAVQEKQKEVADKKKELVPYSRVNQTVTIPITDNKSITIRYGDAAVIDDYIDNNGYNGITTEKKAAQFWDELNVLIESLGLNDEEKQQAESYAGIRLLSKASTSDGKKTWWKELITPAVKGLQGIQDSVHGANEFAFDRELGTNKEYAAKKAEEMNFYEENPDRLGLDLYNSDISGYQSNYLRDVQNESLFGWTNDVTPLTKVISEYGMRSAGQMVGAMGMATLTGIPQAMSAATAAVSATPAAAAIAGSKIGKAATNVLSKTPAIPQIAKKGALGTLVNRGIGAVNKLSLGGALKFLNPLDNPTTAIMGVNAYQDKYDDLLRMGYDEETANKNALFTGYVNTVTEKMGYGGNPENFFKVGNGVVSSAMSPSKLKNAGNILKNYLKANISEGIEEIYATVFERLGDKLTGVGYIDENGKFQQRSVFGDEGVLDPKAIGESFAGGFIGGAVMGSVGVISDIANMDTKTIKSNYAEIQKATNSAKQEMQVILQKAGIDDIAIPAAPDFKKTTVGEVNDYYEAMVDCYKKILSDERVIEHDSAIGNETAQTVDNTAQQQYNNSSERSTTGGIINGEQTDVRRSDLGGYRGISPDGQIQQEGAQRGRSSNESWNIEWGNQRGNTGSNQLLSERTVNALRNNEIEPVPMRHVGSGEEFHRAISEAKQTNTHGAYVTAYDAADYGNMKTFLSDNGKTGIAVKPDGDIVSVFNAPDSGHKRATDTMIPFAIENGGNKLDNYDGKLSWLYQKFGFEPVAKVKFDPQYAPADWNYERDGQPDIIFWKHNGDSADVVAENIGNYPIHDLSQVPYFDSYDEAAAYRDSLIEQSNNIADSADTGSASFMGGNTTTTETVAPNFQNTETVNTDLENSERLETQTLDRAVRAQEEAARTAQEVQETIRRVEEIGKAIGRKVEWYIDQSDPVHAKQNGYYKDGVVHINENAQNPYMTVLGHESFHSLNAKDRAAIINFVKENTNTDSADFQRYRDERRRAYTEEYQKRNRLFSDWDFWEEYAADNMENFFQDETFINQLARQNKTVAQRLWNSLRDLWERIKGVFSPKHYSVGMNEAGQSSGMTDAQFRQIERMFQKALGNEMDIGTDGKSSIIKRNGATVIKLDRNIFKDVNGKDIPQKLMEYLRNELAGKEVTVWNSNPNTGEIDWESADTVRLAKENEKVNGNNILGKLAYPGHNYHGNYKRRANIAVHADEMLQVSKLNEFKADRNSKHGNFAKNGWEYRKALVEDNAGNVYEVVLNIANGDENILYDISSIKNVTDKIKAGSRVGVTENQSANQDNQLSSITIPQNRDSVNSSISENNQNDTEKSSVKRSKFYDSTQNTDNLTAETKEAIAQQAEEFEYEGITNKETIQKALNEFQNDPLKTASQFLTISPKQAGAVDVATGFVLLQKYQEMGDYSSAVEAAKKLREIGTQKGQEVQAFSILNRLTPEGMLYYAQSELDSALEIIGEKKGKEWLDKNRDKFKLTDDEAKFIVDSMKRVPNIKDERQRKVIIGEVQKLVQEKLPKKISDTIADDLRAWQRVSMLLNPKTIITRNAFSNVVAAIPHLTSETIGSGLDKAVSKATGMRSTPLPNLKNLAKGFVKGGYDSFDDFRRGINTRDIQDDRFNIGSSQAFRGKNPMSKAMRFLDRVTSFLLDFGDRPFYESYFLDSINGQMKANKVDKPTADMIDIATQSALEKTWQDNNKITDSVKWLRKGLNFGLKFGLGDIVVPFIKTPANLGKALVDFSPVGFTKGLVVDGTKLIQAQKRGTLTPQMQRKFVNNVSKGITGMLLYLGAYALAASGKLTGSDAEDDKDARSFKRNVLGENPYAIKWGNKTYTYDWAQPLGGIMAISADIANNKSVNGESAVNIITNALAAGGNTLFEQSVLTGVSEFFKNADDGAVSALQGAAADIPAQVVPTLLKQISDYIDPVKRSTYDPNAVQQSFNTGIAKIPGLEKGLQPVVDVLGRDVKRYGGKNNLFNVFLNPANVNVANPTPELQEVWKVFEETQDTSVFPKVVGNSITNKGIKYVLSAEEKTDYQRTLGEETNKGLKELMSSKGYKSASATDKAEYIKTIIANSDSKAKKDLLKKKGVTDTIEDFKQDISNKKKYYSIWSEVEPDNVEKQARGKAIGEVSSVVNALSQKSKLTPTVISGINKYVDKIESRSAKAVDKELYRLGVLKEDYTDTENGNIGVSGSYMSLFEYTDDGQKYSIKVNYSDMPKIMQEIETETYQQLEKLFNNQYTSQKKKTYGQRYNYKNASADQKIKWVSEVKTDVRNQFKEKYKRKYGVTKVANKLKAVK